MAFAEKKEHRSKKLCWFFGVWGDKNLPFHLNDGEGFHEVGHKKHDENAAYHEPNFPGVDHPATWYEFNWNLEDCEEGEKMQVAKLKSHDSGEDEMTVLSTFSTNGSKGALNWLMLATACH